MSGSLMLDFSLNRRDSQSFPFEDSLLSIYPNVVRNLNERQLEAEKNRGPDWMAEPRSGQNQCNHDNNRSDARPGGIKRTP